MWITKPTFDYININFTKKCLFLNLFDDYTHIHSQVIHKKYVLIVDYVDNFHFTRLSPSLNTSPAPIVINISCGEQFSCKNFFASDISPI